MNIPRAGSSLRAERSRLEERSAQSAGTFTPGSFYQLLLDGAYREVDTLALHAQASISPAERDRAAYRLAAEERERITGLAALVPDLRNAQTPKAKLARKAALTFQLQHRQIVKNEPHLNALRDELRTATKQHFDGLSSAIKLEMLKKIQSIFAHDATTLQATAEQSTADSHAVDRTAQPVDTVDFARVRESLDSCARYSSAAARVRIVDTILALDIEFGLPKRPVGTPSQDQSDSRSTSASQRLSPIWARHYPAAAAAYFQLVENQLGLVTLTRPPVIEIASMQSAQLRHLQAQITFRKEPSLASWLALMASFDHVQKTAFARGDAQNFLRASLELDPTSEVHRSRRAVALSGEERLNRIRVANAAKTNALLDAEQAQSAIGKARPRTRRAATRPPNFPYQYETAAARSGPNSPRFSAPTTPGSPRSPVSLLTRAIARNLLSSHEPTRLEATVAERAFRSPFTTVIALNEQVAGDSGALLTEIDITLENALIEVTYRHSGKNRQLQTQVNNPLVNPLGKPVILYAPNYAPAAVRRLPKGTQFVDNLEDLDTLLFSLRSNELKTQAQAARRAR